MRRNIIMFLTIIIVIVFSIYFNKHIIEIRFYEMNIYLAQAAIDAYASRTFNITSKYELIKRRIESKEEAGENYEEEGNLMVILTADTLPRPKTYELGSQWHPTRILLTGVKLLLGKEQISYVVNESMLIQLEQAYLHERNRQYKKAVTIYDEILQGEPTPQMRASILMHKAFCLSFLSQYEESAQLYRSVATEYSTFPEGALSRKLYDFVISIQEKKISTISGKKKNSHTLGKELYSHMDYRGAINQLNTYLKSGNAPQKNSAHFYKGRAHEEIGEYPDAVNEYSSLTQLGKNNPWAQKANRRLVMLGSFYEQKSQTITEAKKRLIAQGDTSFIKNVETLEKLALVKESATVPVTKSKELSRESKIEVDSTEIRKEAEQAAHKEQEARELARRKREKEKRLREQEREAEKQRTLDRKRRLANSPVRSAAFIKSTIDSKSPDLKKIYLKYIRENSAVNGELVVEMKINASGNIEASFISSTIENRSFKKAIINEIESWKFPAVDEDLGSVKIRYPFSFSPQ